MVKVLCRKSLLNPVCVAAIPELVKVAVVSTIAFYCLVDTTDTETDICIDREKALEIIEFLKQTFNISLH